MPDFALSNPSAAETVTARPLLTRTTGVSDDAVAKFAATLQVMSLIGSDAHGRANYLHNGAAAYRIA
ncbi:hypothetical protein [Lentzea sp. NPDC004782]|uniref:hypothetical protein n=1 Tax=Lentzea sp. NPDC004782 TaxID=3154458 RepID=UPI0033AB1BCD